MKGAANVLATIILGWLFYLALAGITSDMWYSKFRYSWQYGVEFSQITQNPRPRDCNFFAAPMGDKACHYDRQVSTVLTGIDSATGRRIVIYSNDGSREWNDGNNPVKSSVSIWWQKVDE
jgi:hypothetical protein